MIGKYEDIETKNSCYTRELVKNLDYNSSSLKDTEKGQTHISKVFLQEAEPLQMRTADHKNTDLDWLKLENWWFLKLHLYPNQYKNCPWADHALRLEQYKTPHYPLQGGSHGLEGIRPPWPSLPGKAIKATFFYFTKNSLHVSIWHQWTEAEFWQQEV